MEKHRGKKRYGIDLETAQHHLDEWLEAELEVTTHQSYQMGNKSLTMADLDKIGNRIDYWRNRVEQLKIQEATGGRGRITRVVPRDY
jgi:hypothetical protein